MRQSGMEMTISANDEKKFWAKVSKKASGCWVWTGRRNEKGYGIIDISRSSQKAHRVSWIINRGEIPDGLSVLHDCPIKDNRSCVNPDHLWLGTQKDNLMDALAKGMTPKGESHWNSKLTDDQVSEIRILKKSGMTTIALGRKFGVTRQHIGKIVRNIRRK